MKKAVFCGFLALLFACHGFAEDFTTLDGKTYNDAQVVEHNPAGIVIENNDGVFQIPFKNLPERLRKKYNYDPKKAEEYLKTRKEDVSKWDAERSEQIRKERDSEEKAVENVDADLRKEAELQKRQQKDMQKAEQDMKQDLQQEQAQDAQQDSEEASPQQPDDAQLSDYADCGGGWYNGSYWPYYHYWRNHGYHPFYNPYDSRKYGRDGYHGRGEYRGGGGYHGGGGFHGGGGGRR